MDDTASGGLGRRLLGWLILIAVAVIALKLAIGAVFGLIQLMFTIAILIAVVMGVGWALRHI